MFGLRQVLPDEYMPVPRLPDKLQDAQEKKDSSLQRVYRQEDGRSKFQGLLNDLWECYLQEASHSHHSLEFETESNLVLPAADFGTHRSEGWVMRESTATSRLGLVTTTESPEKPIAHFDPSAGELPALDFKIAEQLKYSDSAAAGVEKLGLEAEQHQVFFGSAEPGLDEHAYARLDENAEIAEQGVNERAEARLDEVHVDHMSDSSTEEGTARRVLETDSQEMTEAIKQVDGANFGMREVWIKAAEGKSKASARIGMSDTRSESGQSAHTMDDEDYVEEEVIEKADGCGRFVMLPGNRYRLAWDVMGGILIMYDMFKIPLGVFPLPKLAFFDAMDWLTLIFWTLDMPASLFVGFHKAGVTIMEPKEILKNYLLGWFFIDVIVVVPDWLFRILASGASGETGSDGSESLRLLRGLRIARTARLLRVMKLKWVLDAIIDYLDSQYVGICFDIVRMLMALVCINHFLACIWYSLGSGGDTGWAREFSGYEWAHLYLLSLHWAVTQFTPASMSVQPTTESERAYAVCVVFFALVFFSYIVGSITGSLGSLREMATIATKEFWLLRRYLKRNQVPMTLSIRILRFTEHAYNQEKKKMSMSQVRMLTYLSPQLSAELQCCMNLPHLQVHPLFEHLSEAQPIMVNRVVKDAVTCDRLARSDTLFLPMQTGSAMYFVKSGRILYTRVLEGGEQKAELVDADEDWVSEAVLWCAAWLHVGEAKAFTELELVLVHPTPFENIAKVVRPVARLCALYARAFMEWQKTLEPNDVIQGDEETENIRLFIPDATQ